MEVLSTPFLRRPFCCCLCMLLFMLPEHIYLLSLPLMNGTCIGHVICPTIQALLVYLCCAFLLRVLLLTTCNTNVTKYQSQYFFHCPPTHDIAWCFSDFHLGALVLTYSLALSTIEVDTKCRNAATGHAAGILLLGTVLSYKTDDAIYGQQRRVIVRYSRFEMCIERCNLLRTSVLRLDNLENN
jgi:hypothetical protein